MKQPKLLGLLTENGDVLRCTAQDYIEQLKGGRGAPYKVLRQENLPEGYWLSTVFLGVDHGYWGGPLWFESMVFTRERKEADCERYATMQEALAGHAKMLKEWSDGEKIRLFEDHARAGGGLGRDRGGEGAGDSGLGGRER